MKLLLLFWCITLYVAVCGVQERPNILIIVADDLGYGDLSVVPFTGYGIKTPELEKMASDGVVMTNFHVAAPVCTPSRASILTGIFPWRLGIYSVFGSGPQREQHMPIVRNAPFIFREAGYHTAHVGKWHLGNSSLFVFLMNPYRFSHNLFTF